MNADEQQRKLCARGDELGIAAAQVDEDGRMSAVNDLFFDLTGVEHGAVIDRGFEDFLDATAVEHSVYGEGSVYRFMHPRGERLLRPRGSSRR